MSSPRKLLGLLALLAVTACGGEDDPPEGGDAPSLVGPQLTVRALRDDGTTPFAGARVSLRPIDGENTHFWVHSELARGTPDQVLLVDALGEVAFTVAPGQSYELRVEPYDPAHVAFVQELAPLTPAEDREVVALLMVRTVLPFHGRVVDARSGEPLFGVRIDRGGFTDELKAPPLTDRDGRFEVGYFESQVGHGVGLPFTLTMRDRTPLLLRPELGHATPDTARVLRMERSSSLRLQIVGADGEGIPSALVRLETDRAPQDRTQGEFGASPLPPPPQDREAGPDGRIAFYEVPAFCPLWLMVVAGEREFRHPVPITLEAGETREVVLRIAGHVAVSGVLTDASGAVAAEHEMWLVAGDALDIPFLGANLRRYRIAVTDAAGAFAFDDVPPGRYVVGPAPSPTSELAAASVAVEVGADGPPAPVAVVATRGLFLEGRLLGPDGEPRGPARLFAEAEDGRFGDVSEVDESGRIRIGPLIADEYRLKLLEAPLADHVLAEPATVTVPAGDATGGELRLVPGAILRGSVAGSAPAPSLVHVYLSPLLPAAGDAVGPAFAVPVTDGGFTCPAVFPGRYDVLAASMAGSIAVLRDVELGPGSDAEPLRFNLEPAGWVTVVNRGEARWVKALLAVDGRPLAWANVDRWLRKTFVLPPGTVELRLTDRQGRADVHALRVVAGEELEVVF